MKIIAIYNQKGGVGKTTTAVNLAAAVAISGKKVLLIDIDSQGNASTNLGIPISLRKITICDILLNQKEIHDAIQKTFIPNLHAIPSIIELAAIEKSLIKQGSNEQILRDKLQTLRRGYDYVFIDCGPSLSALNINALCAAHSVIIPLQCEFLSMEGIAYLLGTLKLVKETANKNLNIEGVVLTMFDKRNRLCIEVAEEVKTEFGPLVYDSRIPRNIKLSEAPSHGRPAIIYDPKCLGSLSYIMLAQEFMKKSRII